MLPDLCFILVFHHLYVQSFTVGENTVFPDVVDFNKEIALDL